MAPTRRTSPGQQERSRLCDTLERVGPDAPTLCSPWSARDLAAHLAWREGLLDLSPKRLLGLLRGRATRASYAALDWPELVATVRSGPPRVSPFAVPAVDAAVNTTEFFIHHEDVLRAEPGWTARSVPADLEQALWRSTGLFARRSFRSAPVGLRLVAPGLEPKEVRKVKGRAVVSVKGTPGELVLYCSGRQRVAQVELDGRPDDAAALARFSAAAQR